MQSPSRFPYFIPKTWKILRLLGKLAPSMFSHSLGSIYFPVPFLRHGCMVFVQSSRPRKTRLQKTSAQLGCHLVILGKTRFLTRRHGSFYSFFSNRNNIGLFFGVSNQSRNYIYFFLMLCCPFPHETPTLLPPIYPMHRTGKKALYNNNNPH